MASLQEIFDVRGKSAIVTDRASSIGILGIDRSSLDAVVERLKAVGADAMQAAEQSIGD